MPMAPIVRWGILGAGRVARDFAEGLRALPDAELTAVASRTPATADAFTRRLKPRRVYLSYEALARDEAVDIVYIATPHHRHAADATLCLEHGKPVLCEKPFTLDAAQARAVIELARRKRLFCMEAMWMRCIPLVLRVQAMVRAGTVGEVLMLTADFGVPTPFDPGSRFFDPEQGGGALLDRGVYGLSFASMLLGPPEAVVSRAAIGPTGVDEQTAMVLQYPGGRLALLSASLRGLSSNEAMIMGARGTIRIHAPFYCPQRIAISTFAEPRPVSDHQPGGFKQQVKQRARQNPLARRLYLRLKPLVSWGRREIVQSIQGNGYNYEAAEAARCLRAGAQESPLMPLDETLMLMETVDAIRAQWRPNGGTAAEA
jgi:dihydrodiol dehydrogenase / D-xylose 1-dehydrogenase (NADP)